MCCDLPVNYKAQHVQRRVIARPRASATNKGLFDLLKGGPVFLQHSEEHGEISSNDIQELLGINKTRCFTLVKQMAGMGLIRSAGRGANRRLTSA